MDHRVSLDVADLAAAIRTSAAFAALGDGQLEAIAAIACALPFEAGELIYNEGGDGSDFLLVLSGRLDASRATPVGRQRIATLGAGEICGEVSLLDGKPRSSRVEGAGSGRLLVFDAGAVAALVGRDLEVEVGLLRAFCGSLARKIRQANAVMIQIMAPEAQAPRRAVGTHGAKGDIDDETKRSILREQGMSSAELQQLSTFFEAEVFDAGDPIFVEGSPGDTLYIVAEGQVRISRQIPGMGEEALAILDRGEVFGEMAWIDSSPRSADALAHVGGCTVLGITRRLLDGTLDATAETHALFLRVICQVLCRRIRAMNDTLVAYRTMAFF